MAKCLVTGAAGFIGSHLCEKLVADGHIIYGVDDLSGGTWDNVKSLDGHYGFRKETVSLENFQFKFTADWVFHLAAKADIVPSIEDPTSYHQTNVLGTFSMLQLARQIKAKRFIYAASSSCYGIPEHYPTPETAPCDPMYPYALTKYMGEQYVMHWAKVYKLPAVSLRLFNVYGPRARTSGAYGAVFGTFLAQMANGQPLTVVGDGTQRRDFTYVTDVVDAFVKAAEGNVSGEIINIGTGSSPTPTVNTLAKLLGGETVHIPKRPGEPQLTQANINKAFNLLNWLPEVTFEDGVAIMKELIPQYKDAPLWTPEKIEKATKPWFEALS